MKKRIHDLTPPPAPVGNGTHPPAGRSGPTSQIAIRNSQIYLRFL